MELVETSTGSDPTPLVRKLSANMLLSPDEVSFLDQLQSNIVRFEAGETIIRDGQDLTTSFVIMKGRCIRYAMTPRGRRQILGVTLPGDFLALKLNFVRQARYNVEALTATEAALIEPMRVIDIYRQYPVIASGLDWSTVREFNILSEHNVSLGARTAAERIVHFLLELWCRLALIGHGTGDTFEHQLTQQQLADAMGLSLVHTNKTLKGLIRKELIEWNREFVKFPDIREAMDFADFDSSFLDTFQRTRNLGQSGHVRDDITAANKLGMDRVLKSK